MIAAGGYSELKDSVDAGEQAITNALTGMNKDPDLVFLFTTDSYNQKKVFNAVKSRIGNSKLVGFCGGGIITPKGVLNQGVGVLCCSGDKMEVKTSLQKNVEENSFQVGKSAGQELLSSGIKKGTVFIFPEGFASYLSHLIQGMYHSLGPEYKYAGGGAGDNLKFFKTFQFTEKGVESGALASALVGGIDLEIYLGHGWKPKKDPMVITESEGKKVIQINGISAFDSYSRQLGSIDKDNFSQYGMKYPLGFPDLSGNYLIRDPINLNPDNSIEFVSEIPKNAVGNVMEGEIGDLIKTAGEIADQAKSKIEKPKFILLFDCISRYLLMQDKFQDEVELVHQKIGTEVPLIGALTFGEVGCYSDVPLLHNKTMVMVLG